MNKFKGILLDQISHQQGREGSSSSLLVAYQWWRGLACPPVASTGDNGGPYIRRPVCAHFFNELPLIYIRGVI